MSTFTTFQQEAIEARGNVIVSAGAGTGKTRTVVERCVRLIQEGNSLDNILMVTFTEAAAAEMRARLRKSLEEWRDELRQLACDSSAVGNPSLPSPSPRPYPAGRGGIESSDLINPNALTAQEAGTPDPLSPGERSGVRGDAAPTDMAGAQTESLFHASQTVPTIEAEASGTRETRPSIDAVVEQLALLDTAHISTLHGFCLQLVREHFHDLAIDPQVIVLDDSHTLPLIHETFDALFERCYRDEVPFAAAARDLIRGHGGGSEEKIRALTLKLHRHAQSLPDPTGWLDGEIARWAKPQPAAWQSFFIESCQEWRAEWRPEIQRYTESPNVRACADALAGWDSPPTAQGIVGALERIRMADEEKWPKPHFKKDFRDPIKKFFAEAEFLRGLVSASGEPDSLIEDAQLLRAPMLALLELTRAFSAGFTRAKRAQGGVDFADLEQLALQLLRDENGAPTATARVWQEQFAYIFVDEYQDINAAQDAIIQAVSRDSLLSSSRGHETPSEKAEGDQSLVTSTATTVAGNRFLVGDVKQSIYRFRLANPAIFRGYEDKWRAGRGGQHIPLADNFRSRERLLDFINPLFAALMRRSVGGITYEADAQLRFGNPEGRTALSAAANPAPRVELHLLHKPLAGEAGEDENGSDETESSDSASPAEAATEMVDLRAIEKEARLVARRLRALRESGHEIWDETTHQMRPVEWRDMVVLLRSPGPRGESFAQEFSSADVPLAAARAGFFSALEVRDLLSLLRLLENPLQDIPLVAVLHSPLFGFSADELAILRIEGGGGPFFVAARRFLGRAAAPEGEGQDASTRTVATTAREKLQRCFEHLERWRRLVRHTSLSHCLETALAETHYEALLQAGPRGRARVANVRRLLDLARGYDPYQRQGLFRFLRFVDSQEDAGLDQEVAPVETANAVRLMSIHQSKGLEFPVVVVACLGAKFNELDLREDILLSTELGLCARVIAPESGRRYPGLPWWRARRRAKSELAGEELRLLYVALTRARDTLVLTAFDTSKSGGQPWPIRESEPIGDHELLKQQTYLGWLRLWLGMATKPEDWHGDQEGGTALLRWKLHPENAPEFSSRPEKPAALAEPGSQEPPFDLEILRQRLAWQYGFDAATHEPAKTNVSALRRRWMEDDGEARVLFRPAGPRRIRTTTGLDATEIGSAHHAFLQHVAVPRTESEMDLRNEAARLAREGQLTVAESDALDFAALRRFWQSPLGRRVRAAEAGTVHRELPFTARFQTGELRALQLSRADFPTEESVVVQGVVDLAILRRDGISLVDFKTDRVEGAALAERAAEYGVQLRLYAAALARIYGKPITDATLYFLQAGEAVPVQTTS